MARTRSGKLYNTLVAVKTTKPKPKTTTPAPYVPYTPDEILSFGLTTPTINLHEGLTPAMYAMWRAKCQIASIARPRYYKIVMEILNTHGSVALGHVSDTKDTLLQWALGCYTKETCRDALKPLIKLIHTIIHHMDTPTEMSTSNYNGVTPLFWAFYTAHDTKFRDSFKYMYKKGIIIHLLNKCAKKGWTREDINFQSTWFRKWDVPKTFHISDLTTPELNKRLVKVFL